MSSTVNDYKTGEFIRIATPTDIERAERDGPPPGYMCSENPRERMCIASAGLCFNSDSGWYRSDGQPLRWLTFDAAWTECKFARVVDGGQSPASAATP